MPEEFLYPNRAAEHSAISLAQGNIVNGLIYNQVLTEDTFDEETGDILLQSDAVVASTTFVYYPANVVSGEPYSLGCQMEEGDPIKSDVLRYILKNNSKDDMLRDFIQRQEMASTVEFAFAASREGISLLEKRDAKLREHRSPLAAVAIYADISGYAAVFSTPYFVWPWAALAEMAQYME